jgi:hypothetical protein
MGGGSLALERPFLPKLNLQGPLDIPSRMAYGFDAFETEPLS